MAVSRRYKLAADAGYQRRLLLIFAAFCAVAYPYILPGMHERYMYLGDILTLTAAFTLFKHTKMWYAAECTECASILTVFPVLKYKQDTPYVIETGVVMAGIALFFLCRELRAGSTIRSSEIKKS